MTRPLGSPVGRTGRMIETLRGRQAYVRRLAQDGVLWDAEANTLSEWYDTLIGLAEDYRLAAILDTLERAPDPRDTVRHSFEDD